MPDLSEITFSEPHHLPLLLACGAVIVLGALIPLRRHDAKVRWIAAGVRLVALVALGLVILAPVITVEAETRFEPQGTWVLMLDGGEVHDVRQEGSMDQEPRVFRESPGQFVGRIRDALASGSPPEAAIVCAKMYGRAKQVGETVEALGIACEARGFTESREEPVAVLTGVEAPVLVKPGEALIAKVGQAGADATLLVTLDGEVVEPVDGQYEVRTEVPGKHVLEAVLKDLSGSELQRAGHVFRVGENPRALAVGMTQEQLDRAARLAPNINLHGIAEDDFAETQLADTELVLISVDTLNQLPEAGANALASFVVNGGGLYVTGDGAKYVAPEYMLPATRRVLPVLLRKEDKQPPPEDPKVEEEEGLSEITKVSICFVIDNSGSMDRTVGNTSRTRWDIAAKGVIDSVDLIRKGGDPEATESELAAVDTRVTVISFTLKQERIFGPNEVFRGSVPVIRDALTVNRKRDDQYAEGGSNTDIYAAMENALDVMEKERAAVKMIVMLTDGGDRPNTTLQGKRHTDLRDRAIRNDINVMAVGIGDVFDGASIEADAARRVLKDLVTNDNYARIPVGRDAEKASAIFVEATEVSFKAYDNKVKKAEEERKRRLKKLEEDGKEPDKIDVMPGTYPLRLGVVGAELFGKDALPETAPKVQWLARNDAREGAAVALSARTDDGDTPALVFKGYGLGRVAFWGVGTDPEALGELSGWQDFPAIFAASLRWLLPRDQPDVELVGEATSRGIRLLDPLPEATYALRTESGDTPLKLDGERLVNQSGLPLGPGEVIETVDGEERSLGDVYVAEVPPAAGSQFAVDERSNLKPLQSRAPEVTAVAREATMPILYLLTLLMLAMPVERLVRRRT